MNEPAPDPGAQVGAVRRLRHAVRRLQRLRAGRAAVPGFGERLSVVWRDKQIEYTRLVSMAGQRRSFRALTLAGLRFAAARLGLELVRRGRSAPDGAVPAARAVRRERRGARRAAAARYPRRGAEQRRPRHAGRTDRQCRLRFPARPGAERRGDRPLQDRPGDLRARPAGAELAAGEILFVSSNCWDAIGATWYGYTTLWVNRFGLPLDPLETQPTRTGSSLRDVLDFFF